MRRSRFLLSVSLIACLTCAAAPLPRLPRSLSWQTVENRRGTLAKGKLNVVVFVAPDAAGTQALRQAQSLSDQFGPSGVVVVAVVLSKDRAAAERLTRESDLTIPVHFDPRLGGTGLARQWGVAVASGGKGREGTGLEPPAAFLLDTSLHVAAADTLARVSELVPRQLELTPPRMVDEKTFFAAVDALSLAQDMLAAGKPRSAARYLSQVPPESRKDPEVASRLADLTTTLDQALPDLLAETEEMAQQSRQPEAILLLEQCAAALEGTPSQAQVLEQLHSFTDDTQAMKEYEKGRPSALALDLLDSASDYESRGDLVSAYRLCTQAAQLYPNTPGALDAQARIALWEADKDQKRKLHDALYGEKANALLSQAESYQRSNLTEKARGFYEQILKNYPDTTAAQKASEALHNLK